MKTVRRLFYLDISSAVAFVALAFLSLFFFIDFVSELEDIGKRGYSVVQALGYSLLMVPGHLYELLPIAVLIGSIYALARMAQSSEFTILRTGGLGPGRALALLSSLGICFAALTFVVGDYVAPFAEQRGDQLRSKFNGGLGGGGAWLKDHYTGPDGERNVAVHVGSARGGELMNIRIFEFDADGALHQRMAAARATVSGNGQWVLADVQRTVWTATVPGGAAGSRVVDDRLPTLVWKSTLSPQVVSAAVSPLATMSTSELWRYIGHLAANEQAAQRHEIQFWKRAFYPFACLVMIGLALPFAYLHARNGGVSLKIFGGVLLGISFVLLNNVAGHLGLLRNWTPWITAAVPSALYLVMSLGAFAWLVRYR